MTVYYNEHDPFAAEWLRQLIKHGHIAEGIVDERDIQDVVPSELEGFTQCHFFAGIGGWSRALRLAGWPDSKPVWTGSCPCQPFSQAGRGGGFADERHLWPAFHHLIAQCRPPIVFGEQVASPAGRDWLDTVQTDLEGVGFAVGAADLCAAGIGAPHIRQRIWFVAERVADSKRDGQHRGRDAGKRRRDEPTDDDRASGRLAQPDSREQQGRAVGQGDERNGADARWAQGSGSASACGEAGEPGPTSGFWRDADWLFCRDGNWRPVEPGTFPLANGIPNRVGKLRGYGNAIVPQIAAQFIGVIRK